MKLRTLISPTIKTVLAAAFVAAGLGMLPSGHATSGRAGTASRYPLRWTAECHHPSHPRPWIGPERLYKEGAEEDKWYHERRYRGHMTEVRSNQPPGSSSPVARLVSSRHAVAAVGTAELHLIALECVKTEDKVGPDHAYLLANGLKVWGPQAMNRGDTADLRQLDAIPLPGSVQLKLFDEDFPDDDDLLGDPVITPSQSDPHVRTVVFSQDGAHDILRFTVSRR